MNAGRDATTVHALFGCARADCAAPNPAADAHAWTGVFQGDVHEGLAGFESFLSHPSLREAVRLAATVEADERTPPGQRTTERSAVEPASAF